MRTSMLRPVLAIAAVALVVAACSSSGSSATPSAATTAPEASAAGAMTVTDAWARAMAPGSTTSAVYLKIANGTGQDDALVAVKSTAPGVAEIHEVSMVSAAPDASADSGGMGGMQSAAPMGSAAAGGMMGMHPIEKLPLPSGQSVEL